MLRRGKYLGQILDEADFIRIENYLKKIKVELQIGNGKGIIEVEGFFLKSGKPLLLEPHNAAMFVTDGFKMKIILRENATVYEVLHELMHMRDCQSVGMKVFMNKSLIEREKFVYDKMVEYSKYLNRKELKHSEWYINSYYDKYGVTDKFGNPLLENLPFKLDDIPKKRQKVTIDKILNFRIMITKEQALENVKKYINERKRNYVYIDDASKIKYKENDYINYGKYEEQERNIYVVNYDIEGYTEPISHFVAVDAETGEVLFTATPHGYVEDWEE